MRTVCLLHPVLAFLVLGRFPTGHGKQELLARSKRVWVLSTIEVVEEDPGPFPKEVSKMFNDKTKKENDHRYEITGMGVTQEPVGVFSIDPETGVVFAHRTVDREQHSLFHINFNVFDKHTDKKIDKELAFDVEIMDVNDNAPKFLRPVIRANVSENTGEGYLPVQIQVVDLDKPNSPNSSFTLRVVSQEPRSPEIDVEHTKDKIPQLTFKGCFDYDKFQNYKIILQANDHGKPSLTSTMVISLDITDSNSHAPTFREKAYHGEVLEMVITDEVMRFAVDDADTPNTPGWRAEYFFVEGNEEGNYKLETDPKTNEGILSVVKGKDYERTSIKDLVIGVKNEEPLFVCGEEAGKSAATAPPNTATVRIKVIDVNDPPVFERSTIQMFQREEEEPGMVLFTPKVTDVDSDVSKIRYVLVEDPADFVKIDEKTGAITSIKKMDRESPFVQDNVYKIVMCAIDSDEPPATGTCTVLVNLKDINDNQPKVANSSLVMCWNKADKVMVPAEDDDAHPFSGPFTFHLDGDGTDLDQHWKLDPAFGEKAGLVSLKELQYGNYSVPLLIQDQQGEVGRDVVHVTVCDCEDKEVCRDKKPISYGLGKDLIGLLIAAMLLFLLLLLIIICKCGEKDLRNIPMLDDEGNQTLIKYNQEAGGSACKTTPEVLLNHMNGLDRTDGPILGSMQRSYAAPVMSKAMNFYSSPGFNRNASGMSLMRAQGEKGTLRDGTLQSNYSSWASNNTSSSQQEHLLKHQGFRAWPNQHTAAYMHQRLKVVDGTLADDPVCRPNLYAYEGQGSTSRSLDALSLGDPEDDFQFLNNLEPQFKTLANVCQETIHEKTLRH